MINNRQQINADELQVFFGLIGSGIWYLQHVEDALSTYITVKAEIKKRGGTSADNAKFLLSKHRRNTLGSSIRFAEDRHVLNPELLTMVKAFKLERDWLVHRSLHENGDDLYLDSDRYKLLERLAKFSEDAKRLQRVIAEELEDFVVSKGVSREWIHQKTMSDVNRDKSIE
ncbi:MAG: hypothetical protein WCQ20_07440 [Synechococcaceae cyanobacterium ELA739]|jgi:hypothetical protein